MNRQQRERIESLFNAALDLESDARAAFLEQACADEPALLTEVNALLAAHERSAGLLEVDVTAVASALLTPLPPARIGPYSIVRQLGAGGMGAVFLAERDDGQFHRLVAIKVMRAGTDPGELSRRLEQERQILASLDHPNIARLFDGGVLPDGRPYLVMEYVQGQPIDAHCDAQRLTIEQRLALFCPVARAVHYAHGNLVVHRDLKPSNILVNEQGVPKLLDFGIAKILDAAQTGAAPATRTGLRLLTPEYASPEQAEGAPATTANDVYALGVVLYELLTGRRPLSFAGLSAAAAERVLLWREPPRPGSLFEPTRAHGGGASDAPAAADVAGLRRATAQRLARRLSGDIDRIVLMALRKEPERRYASAEQLAEDIERHLAGRPVLARGASARYRTWKFVARHRWGVAAAALLLCTLCGGIVATLWQAGRASRAAALASAQRERAEQEAGNARRAAAMVMDLFRLSDPNQTLGDTITAREVLDRGTERVLREFGDQPELQAGLLGETARIYANLGLLTRAESLVRRSLALREQKFGENSMPVSESLAQLGQLLSSAGQRTEAIAAFRRGIAIRDTTTAPDSLLANMQMGLGWEVRAQGDYEEAGALFQRAVATEQRLFGDSSAQAAAAMLGLASTEHDRGRFDDAEAMFGRALAGHPADLETPHPMAATALLNIGMIRRIREQYAQAEPLVATSLAMREKLYEPTHPQVLEAVAEYALLQQLLGRYREAVDLLRPALERAQQTLGPLHPVVGTLRDALGLTLEETGRYGEALAQFDTLIAGKRALFPGDHPQTEFALVHSAEPLLELGRTQEAERRLREAEAMGNRMSGENRVYRVLEISGRARAARERRQLALSDSLFRTALALASPLLRPDHRYVLALRREYAALQIERGQARAAIPALDSVLALQRAHLPDPHPLPGRTLRLLGSAWLEAGEPARAETLLRQALVQLKPLPAGHWLNGDTRSLLGAALRAQGRTAEAGPLLQEGARIVRAHLGSAAARTQRAEARLIDNH